MYLINFFKKMEGTSNEAIINFFENETDDDLKKILSVFFRQTM